MKQSRWAYVRTTSSDIFQTGHQRLMSSPSSSRWAMSISCPCQQTAERAARIQWRPTSDNLKISETLRAQPKTRERTSSCNASARGRALRSLLHGAAVGALSLAESCCCRSDMAAAAWTVSLARREHSVSEGASNAGAGGTEPRTARARGEGRSCEKGPVHERDETRKPRTEILPFPPIHFFYNASANTILVRTCAEQASSAKRARATSLGQREARARNSSVLVQERLPLQPQGRRSA